MRLGAQQRPSMQEQPGLGTQARCFKRYRPGILSVLRPCNLSRKRSMGPVKDARKIITFDRTWLFIGRKYTYRNKGCIKTIRNTISEFLKQCLENTRHRFPTTTRKNLQLRHRLLIYLVKSGCIPGSKHLGEHVRRLKNSKKLTHFLTSSLLTQIMQGNR